MQAQETEPVTAADLPQLTDQERWGGEVVGASSTTIAWGTHEFEVDFQQFASGEGHMQVRAPSSAPPAAREIVGDLLAGNKGEAAVGAILADGWGIDVEELEADVE